MPDSGPFYRVSFTIGPVENPSTIGLRIAELVALLKQDDGTDVQVAIRPFAFDDGDAAT